MLARLDADAAASWGIMERLPSLAVALEGFLRHLTLEGRSPATIRTYRALLLLEDGPLLSLTTEVCFGLVATRMGQSRNTARTFSGALASFTRYCATAYGVPDVMEKVPTPRQLPPAPHRFLTKAQLRDLWQACPDDSYRLLLLLLMEGLRASEACGLRTQDVVGDVATVRGKGGKYRKIVCSGPLRAILGELASKDEYVLGYGYDELRRRVRRLGRLAKIPYPLNPHALRHAFASNALLEGMDVLTLQQLGGWANTKMISEVYGRSAMQEAALRKARNFALTERLLGE